MMNYTQPHNIYKVTSMKTSYSLLNNNKEYLFVQPRVSGDNAKKMIASSLINSYFYSIRNNESSLLYSSPTYSITNSKVTIHIFYYVNFAKDFKGSGEAMPAAKISSLSNSLAFLYKKEISLVITRIYYPYLNSSIFSKYLAHNAPSNTFIHFKDSILTYPSRNASKLPFFINGIKIELSGRLLTEAVVPRITRKTTVFGSFSGAVDYAKYTTKNELGTFTIKV